MNSLKTHALAIAAAFAVLAFASTGSASATTLCKKNESPCPEAQQYVKGTKIWRHDETAAIFKGTIETSCGKSWTHIETSATSGVPLIASEQQVTFESCTGCKKVSAEALPYEVELAPTTGGNGTLTVKKLKLRFEECSLGLKCTVTAEKIVLDFEGGPGGEVAKDAVVRAINEPLKVEGLMCGEKLEWSGAYTVTEIQEPKGKILTHLPLWIEK